MIAAAFFAASTAFAAEAKTTEVTVVGKGQCAKCALHQADDCQNTITVSEGGKDQLYYLAENDVSKDFHDQICKGPKQIKVTGAIKEVAGKKEITASKIEVVKS